MMCFVYAEFTCFLLIQTDSVLARVRRTAKGPQCALSLNKICSDVEIALSSQSNKPNTTTTTIVCASVFGVSCVAWPLRLFHVSLLSRGKVSARRPHSAHHISRIKNISGKDNRTRRDLWQCFDGFCDKFIGTIRRFCDISGHGNGSIGQRWEHVLRHRNLSPTSNRDSQNALYRFSLWASILSHRSAHRFVASRISLSCFFLFCAAHPRYSNLSSKCFRNVDCYLRTIINTFVIYPTVMRELIFTLILMWAVCHIRPACGLPERWGWGARFVGSVVDDIARIVDDLIGWAATLSILKSSCLAAWNEMDLLSVRNGYNKLVKNGNRWFEDLFRQQFQSPL